MARKARSLTDAEIDACTLSKIMREMAIEQGSRLLVEAIYESLEEAADAGTVAAAVALTGGSPDEAYAYAREAGRSAMWAVGALRPPVIWPRS